MKHTPLLILIFHFLLISVPSAICPAGTNQLAGLTLELALDLAERQHPQLAEAHALVEAAAGRAQQAGALPNPELVLGAQHLPLDGDASNQREYVVGIAQPIPLGGRIYKARQAELLEQEVRARGMAVTRRDLRKRVHSAFATALFQEQAFQIRNQLAENAGKLVAMSRARVNAGDAVPDELARTEMELAHARAEVRRIQTMREQALLGLAGAIGDPGLNVKSLAGNLDVAFEIPALEALATNLSTYPELLQAEAGVRASEARLALARAERIPEVKVEVLYHRLEGPRENTIDVGLTIPLPLFGQNQGTLRAARAETAAAEARARLTRNEVNLRLRAAHAQLTAALANARAYQAEILPRAEAILKTAEARYAVGETSLADVLPVRRVRAEIELSHLESLRDVMQAWTEVAEQVRASSATPPAEDSRAY